MIERVVQPTPTSCGQACLAMITGVDVESVIAEVPDRARGTYVHELGAYLRANGWKANWLLQRLARGRALPQLAILRMKWKGERLGHWLVWADGQVYDPSPTQYHRGDWSLTSCLEIWR